MPLVHRNLARLPRHLQSGSQRPPLRPLPVPRPPALDDTMLAASELASNVITHSASGHHGGRPRRQQYPRTSSGTGRWAVLEELRASGARMIRVGRTANASRLDDSQPDHLPPQVPDGRIRNACAFLPLQQTQPLIWPLSGLSAALAIATSQHLDRSVKGCKFLCPRCRAGYCDILPVT